VLDEEGGEQAGGVFHCFTETAEVALAAVERGYYISFSGIVSFKNAQDLRDLARRLPLDRILIETDSPYLAPVPFRGKTNTPAYVPHVAQAVADAVGLPVAELAAATTANTRRLFKLPEVTA
jgi:TatD DNase family protein